MKNWSLAAFLLTAAFTIVGFDYLKQTQLVKERFTNVEVSFGLTEYFTSLGLRAKAMLGRDEQDVAEDEGERGAPPRYQMLGAVAAGIANTASSQGGEELLQAVAAIAQGAQAGAAGAEGAPSLEAITGLSSAAAPGTGEMPLGLDALAAQVSAVASTTRLPEHEQLATALDTLANELDGTDLATNAEMLTRIGDMAELALVHDGGERALIEQLAGMAQMQPEQVMAVLSFGHAGHWGRKPRLKRALHDRERLSPLPHRLRRVTTPQTGSLKPVIS